MTGQPDCSLVTRRAATHPAVLCLVAMLPTAALAADLPTKAPAGLLPDIEMTSQGWTATFASEVRYYKWAGDVGFAPRNAPADSTRQCIEI